MRTTIGLALVCLALAACSSSIEPVNVTESGALAPGDQVIEQDNSLYDEYTFRASAGMQIVIDMTSDEFDTYLWLNSPDGSNLMQNDDGDDGTNSHIEFTAPVNGTYTVMANALWGQEECDDEDPECWGGAYEVHIVTTAAE